MAGAEKSKSKIHRSKDAKSSSEVRKGESLLNTVARRLGHAAGTVTKLTHEIGKTLAAAPMAATAKIRDTAHRDKPAMLAKKRGPGKQDAAVGRKANVKRAPRPAKKSSRGGAKASPRNRKRGASIK